MHTCLRKLIVAAPLIAVASGCVTPKTYDHLVRNGLAPVAPAQPAAQWQPLPVVHHGESRSGQLEQRIGHLEAKLAYLEHENDRLRAKKRQVHEIPLPGTDQAIARSVRLSAPEPDGRVSPPPVYLHMLAEKRADTILPLPPEATEPLQARIATPIPVEGNAGEYRAASYGGWRAR